jgi:hypothetical protein
MAARVQDEYSSSAANTTKSEQGVEKTLSLLPLIRFRDSAAFVLWRENVPR